MKNEMFDYYGNTFSFAKVIMENVNDKKKDLKALVVKEIFNEIVNNMDSNEIYEMVIYSSMFEKRLNELNVYEKKNYINNLQSCYLEPMIVNYINSEKEMVKFFFDSLKNKIISFSGFYNSFGDNIEVFRDKIQKNR